MGKGTDGRRDSGTGLPKTTKLKTRSSSEATISRRTFFKIAGSAAVGLAAELNRHTKFLLTPMRGHYNVAGANTVTTWQTGYPYAVDFSRGYPRYNPGEFTSIDLLAKGETDAVLIVASDPAATFPASAVKNLAYVPVITLDQKITPTTMISKVAIPVATAGVEAEGTAYRMDGVALRLKKLADPPDGLLSDKEVLAMINEKLREGKTS